MADPIDPEDVIVQLDRALLAEAFPNPKVRAAFEKVFRAAGLLADGTNQAQQAADSATAAAAAASAAAAEALAAADSAGGASYFTIEGGGFPAAAAVSGVVTSALLDLTGALTGATIDADSTANAIITLSEVQGATTVVVGSGLVTVASDSTQNVDLSWNTSPAAFTISGIGTLSGAVTYELSFAPTGGGANFVGSGAPSATVIITKPAAP